MNKKKGARRASKIGATRYGGMPAKRGAGALDGQGEACLAKNCLLSELRCAASGAAPMQLNSVIGREHENPSICRLGVDRGPGVFGNACNLLGIALERCN